MFHCNGREILRTGRKFSQAVEPRSLQSHRNTPTTSRARSEPLHSKSRVTSYKRNAPKREPQKATRTARRPLQSACVVCVTSRARAAVSFSLEPKRSCVWLLSRLRTAHFKRIPFYNTAKQWRTLQKLALTSVDPSNTEFSFQSSLASLRQLQKASKQSSELIITPSGYERRAARSE